MPVITVLTAAIALFSMAKMLSPVLEGNRFFLIAGSGTKYVVYFHELCLLLMNCFYMVLYHRTGSSLFDGFYFDMIRAPWYGFASAPCGALFCTQKGRRNRRPIFTRWGSSPVPPARPHPRRRTPAQSAGQSGLPARTAPCPRGRSGSRHGCSHQSRPALPPGHPA